MPFARFENWDACILEMTGTGHDKESAEKICGAIKDRAEKGILYKAECVGLEVLSKADEEDIVVGGNASWDVEDLDGDIFTVEAQIKALQRFFKQPPEFQNITANHGRGWAKEFKLAQPMLKYVDSKGKEYFTHVHERGTYLISKLRNDTLRATRYFREKARKGELNGYSVTALPLKRDGKKVTDMEYHAVTITEKDVVAPRNPMTADVTVISKSALTDEEILAKHGFSKMKRK